MKNTTVCSLVRYDHILFIFISFMPPVASGVLLFTAFWAVIVTGFAIKNRLRRWAKPISSHKLWPVIAQQVRDSAVNSNSGISLSGCSVYRQITVLLRFRSRASGLELMRLARFFIPDFNIYSCDIRCKWRSVLLFIMKLCILDILKANVQQRNVAISYKDICKIG